MLKLDANSIIAKYLRRKLSSKRGITEKDLSPIFRELKVALINSDVSYSVIKDFFNEIKQELVENRNYSEKDDLDVIVFSTIKKHLTKILGNKNEDINLSNSKLNKILMVGLNGSGKTTTTAKLSNYFKTKKNAKVKNISLDIYRPGAFDQLKQLSDMANISCYHVGNESFRSEIKSHIESSESEDINCIFFDNYGLLVNNKKLLDEVIQIKKIINPTEILFVVDAMSGQEIIDVVKVFHEHLGITGIVVSKTDSNAPMGGVFSISYMLKIPIKYMGSGEKIDDISLFHPDRVSNLILGEGDILSLAEKLESRLDEAYTRRFFSKLMKGNFDLDDLICQIREVRKIGSLKGIMSMIPGVSKSTSSLDIEGIERQLEIWEIIINSMTTKERKNPKLFKKQPDRKIRVIKGSGKKPEELNRLLKRWEEMKQKMDEISTIAKRGGNPFSFRMGR